MRYLALAEVVELHRRLLEATGAHRIRDLGALESAIAQPKAAFGGVDLYPTLEEKAAALGLSLVQDHPSSTATSALACRYGDVSRSIRNASCSTWRGRIDRSQLTDWLRQHLRPLG